MNILIPALLDELEKIAIELSDKDRGRQMLQFGALGALSAPVISGVGNLIETGSFLPKNLGPGRWVASRMATGALAGGVMPMLRHHIERSNLEAARQRARVR